jgi:hypothetical protein
VEAPPIPACSRPAWAAGIVLLALLSFEAAAADEAGPPVYRIGAAASWVDVLEPDYAAPTLTGDEERSTHHLLVDYQADVRERGQEEYRHYAVRLVNDAGAEDYSQLSFQADPAFEKLTIHSLRVYRDGKLADRLEAARITVLPVESDLQKRIYSGDLTVNLLIPDLRAGDVLDYAYSTDSASPNFPDHFAAEYSIAWSVPVHRQRIRVRHLAGDPVEFRVHGGEAKPVVRTRDGKREIEFNLSDQLARAGESDMPDWHPHWAYVEFSDMPDWSAVAVPTVAMYLQASPGPRTRAVVEELKALPGSDADRVLAALRRVQDEIRYASISIGPGSYRPRAPDLVLERNFGDCKDKSLLLVSLLRSLGVDASVALVNTRNGPVLPRSLPTPYAFDHAIVRARIGDDVLWLDPTATEQRGTLENTAQADFANALVIEPGTTSLEEIPRNAPDAWTRDVELRFDLGAGIDEPASLEVQSRYAGGAADSIRADFASRSVAQRTNDYLNYYAGYYPGIRIDSPLTIEDDPAGNVVVVREHYRLESGFRQRDDDDFVLEFFPDELYGYADGTETPIRTAPMEQAYPAKVSQRFEVRLPEDWPIRSTKVAIDNPAFRYESTVRYARRVLKLEYRFESLSNSVPIEQVPKYLADIKRMYDDLGYELTQGDPVGRMGAGIAPYPLVAAVVGLLAGLWLALRVTLRYDPEPRSPRDAANAPVGIRGWLVLVAINVLVMLGAVIVLVYALMTFSAVDVWSGLPELAEGVGVPFARHGIAALQFLAFLLLPNVAAIAVVFFRKRSSAPRLVTVLLWTLTVFGLLVEQLTIRLVPLEEGDLAKSMAGYAGDLVFLVVWTRYLQVSERVAATFVHRREGVPAPVAAVPAGAPSMP